MLMELKDNETAKAEYERFIDLMARMYLKYGADKIVTRKMIIELFPNTQCGKDLKKGA